MNPRKDTVAFSVILQGQALRVSDEISNSASAPLSRKSYFTRKPCRLQSHPLLIAKVSFIPHLLLCVVFFQTFIHNRKRNYKLLPFLRQFLFTDKLVSWDRPAGRSQETKRPSGIFPPAFYIPIPDGAFPYYNTSYTPLFCDINPNRYQTAQDRSSRT